MEKECYEEEVQPYRKTDYKRIIYQSRYIIVFMINVLYMISLMTIGDLYSNRVDTSVNWSTASLHMVILKQ